MINIEISDEHLENMLDRLADKLAERNVMQPEPLPDNTAFTVDEAAEYLHCCKSSIHRKLKSGEIQGFKSGRWFIHKRELDRWIANGGSSA